MSVNVNIITYILELIMAWVSLSVFSRNATFWSEINLYQSDLLSSMIIRNIKKVADKYIILFMISVVALVVFLGLAFAIIATPLIPNETYIVAGFFFSVLVGAGLYFLGTLLK